jgi:Big-like domain-containing protein/lactonase family protein with 7-bladed beta-propeller
MVVGGCRGWRVGWSVVFALVGMWLCAGSAWAAQPLGALTQLSGTAGCFTFDGGSEDGAATCSQARGLADGESATVSPDGANVYVGSYSNGGASLGPGFAVFSRDQATGALTQLSGKAGCLTSDGSSSAGAGTCTKVRGLITDPGDGHDLVFTSDGRWAYIAADRSPATLLIFERDPSTGALTQLPGTAGCISSDGSSQDGAGTCQTDATLLDASGVSISSDDRFLYVTGTGGSEAIHVFSRNASTGGLTDIECISQAPAPAGCSTGRVVGDTQFIALSPNGTHAYAGQYDFGISIFDRDPSTGLLTQKPGTAGCITSDGKDDTGASTCAVGRQVKGTFPLLIAPNSATLYNVDGNDGGFSAFHINSDGTLTQLSATNGCTTIDGKDDTGASTCAIGRAIDSPYGGAISPDGNALYVSNDASGGGGGIAVFSLNQSTGGATQLSGLQGCITADGSSNSTASQCANGRALSEGYGMSISPDGTSVYQATDDSANAGLAIYRVQTAPVCQPASVLTAFGQPASVPLRCSDADGDAVTRSIVSGPAHGSLSAIDNAAGTVTYTPAVGFTGTDNFTFAATDGVNGGPPATAAITVGPPPPPAPTPALSKLRVSPSKFSLAGRRVGGRCVKLTKKNRAHKHCTLAIKLRVSYTLNVATTVTSTLKRQAAGRKVNGRCAKPTNKNHKHKKCARLVDVHGKIARTGTAGANQFSWNGQIGGRKLGPGIYELTATPAGGKPSSVSFKLVP